MQREVLRVKRARLLSKNQIQEIVIDSDSNEEKYYASEDTEYEEEPRPTFKMVFHFTAFWTTGKKMEALCCPFYGTTNGTF
jgi:hypothetical protein